LVRVKTLSQKIPKTPFFYGWVIVVVAGLNMFAGNVLGVPIMGFFMIPMGEDLGWSRGLISGAILAGSILVIVVAPVAGRMVDTYGPRPVLIVGISMLGAAAVGLSQVNSPVAFYVVYACGRALWAGVIQVAAVTVVGNWFVYKRGQAMSILLLAPALSIILLPLIVQNAIDIWGWRTTWLLLGVLAWIISLVPSFLFIVRRPEDVGLNPDGRLKPVALDSPTGSVQTGTRSSEHRWTVREAIRTPAFWLVTIGGSLLLVSVDGVLVHMVPYLVSRGLTAQVGALTVSVSGGSMIVGTLIWGAVVDRKSMRPIFTFSALYIAIVIALLLFVNNTTLAITVGALMGLSFGGIGILKNTIYANYFGRHSLGAIVGVSQPFFVIGQACGILLSGLIYDAKGSYNIALLTFVALSVVAAICIFAARPPVRRRG
jgi:OFA family oxalate/formate antiporter-like MFS transporter